MNEANIKLVEYLAKKLADFHGEPNLEFYKELTEEIFVRYGGFDDVGAGYATLTSIINRSFEK